MWTAHQPDQHYHATFHHLHPHLHRQAAHVDQLPRVLQDAAGIGSVTETTVFHLAPTAISPVPFLSWNKVNLFQTADVGVEVACCNSWVRGQKICDCITRLQYTVCFPHKYMLVTVTALKNCHHFFHFCPYQRQKFVG